MSTYAVQIGAGSAVGPYVVERKLAQGGMSVLFLAHDPKLDRSVALKMIADDVATAAARARLLREARTLAAVDHPGIVRIYGAGEHEGTPWIAMELVRGTDLKRLLAERGPVPPIRALRWIVQASEALAAAHDVGVIHRDLKPSNLLLTHDDQIKVVDFGIAKRRVESSALDELTNQGQVLGTPAYLSPEQLEHGLADERSDVWGLGCVLFELVVGAPPFGRSNSASTTAAILRDEPSFPAPTAGAVVDVISACLRKSSFARVGSMRELAALARDALDQPSVSIPAAMAATSERLAAESASGGMPSARPASERRSSRFPPARVSSAAASVPAAAALPSSPPSTVPPSMPSTDATRPSHRPPSLGQIARSTTTSRPPSSGTMRAPAPHGNIKGTAIRTGLQWFAQKYGQDAVARATEPASPELRAMIRLDDPAFGIVASAWYDMSRIGELLVLVEQAAGVADEDESIEYNSALAAAIAEDNVSGVYRSLFRLITTPPMLRANAQRVWRTYVDEGVLVVETPRRGELQFQVRSLSRHHAQLCKVTGFVIQHVLRAVGYEALVLERTHCTAMGDGYCGFEGVYFVR